MIDETEPIRRQRISEIAAERGPREILEQRYGKVWSTDEMAEEFDALGFSAPLVVVKRKCDGVKGSLEFQHHPRFYFNWEEYKP